MRGLVDALRLFVVSCAWALVGAAGLRLPMFQAYPFALAMLWLAGYLGIVLS